MKVLLYNPDSTPAVVETSDQEKLTALLIMAFGLFTGAIKQSPEAFNGWAAKVVEVVGKETLEKSFPGLKLSPPQGAN